MKYRNIIIAACLTALLTGCKKEWLDKKPDKSLAVPGTVADLQALLDNTGRMNSMQYGLQQLGESGTDNYYLTTTTWQALASPYPAEYHSYIFDKDIFSGLTNVKPWNLPYERVYYANVVLTELDKIKKTLAPSDMDAWNTAYGGALFLRAYTFSWLQEIYGYPYRAASAATDLSIPLRLSADLNDHSVRATVAQTFGQVIADLNKAIELLPPVTSYKTRPSAATAHALLSRVYLIKGDYDQAASHAGQAIALQGDLLNFSSLTTPSYPMPRFNIEVLYHDLTPSIIMGPSRARVDSTLYNSYQDNDLRKKLFFVKQTGYQTFRGGYDGTSSFWGGIALDEVYLTRAECYVRQNKLTEGLADLNKLLASRWQQNSYNDTLVNTPEGALDLVLTERRKELCFRGLRWIDIRRLNQEARYQTTVKRIVNNNSYLLLPGSNKYAYPLPDDVLQYSGMQQNKRDN